MKKLKILYEDKFLLAVYKKSGLPTIRDKNHVNNLYSEVYDYLHKKNQKVFIVHRLDADTSGIVYLPKMKLLKIIYKIIGKVLLEIMYVWYMEKQKKKG